MKFEMAVQIPRTITQTVEIIDKLNYTQDSIVDGLDEGTLQHSADDFSGFILCEEGHKVAYVTTTDSEIGQEAYDIID